MVNMENIKKHIFLVFCTILSLVQGVAAAFPTGDVGLFLAVLLLCAIILLVTGFLALLYFCVYRKFTKDKQPIATEEPNA